MPKITPIGCKVLGAENHEACRGTLAVLDAAQATGRLGAMPGWELQDGRLQRSFHCASFGAAMDFVQAIALVAEAANHHPNLRVENKRQVDVVLWTRKLHGLTTLDFNLAAAIDTAFKGLRECPA
ncbi:4a-hydroxytetrahydrobiopterin dehydratase [Streptomyces sp. NPDC047028]|uniref:4a-hydroxytetrahydrobiopterin dehydratase n=1 Tax=Streptomyces sp. NPDC047028 TaxID=3155793 RepID=UPI0033D2A7F4